MRKLFTKIICCALLTGLVASGSIAVLNSSVNASAAEVSAEESAASGITVHYKSASGTPTIYYWNSLPQNLETAFPGEAMTDEGDGWYSKTFDGITKINMEFIVNGSRTAELTRDTAGEYWYDGKKWYTKKPGTGGGGNVNPTDWERTDMREDSIYFVMTTRFYDGDTGNNLHCWDDGNANNPDSDPAWRGDFQGLIDKLDYIKALGFSAIWITPVVENASGYDYHGYHAFDFSKVDPRYESEGATYQDLINAAHAKGIKIVQDVVWNHTGNFGEAGLGEMFTKNYDALDDADNAMQVIPGSDLAKSYPNYASLKPGDQFQARLNILKDLKHEGHDPDNNYHREQNMGYESSIEQQGSMAGDCVDLNTENQKVADYINDCYTSYVDMGVDCFRLDTEKHINRWTLNSAYFPIYEKYDNFYIFGEVCARVRDVWNHNIPSSSPPFFTWKETDSAWIGNWNTTDPTANIEPSKKHYDQYSNPSGVPTSTNAYLNGNSYHTPDYSQWNGTGVIDFSMHRNFENAGSAYRAALAEDQYFNDATWVVTYVDSHDYGPEIGSDDTIRYNGGTAAWAENLSLMFSFRGIPCLYYGSEVEFMKGAKIDVGPNAPLATTGRAYFGDYLEGDVTASDFGEYTASGKVNETLNNALAQHIIRLNQIRRAVPALQKGQYSTDGCSGNMAYKRRYTGDGVDSYALVTVSGGATFTGVENGTYIEVVTGQTVNVTNGSLTTDSIGQGNMRCYVLKNASAPSGKIGTDGAYLK